MGTFRVGFNFPDFEFLDVHIATDNYFSYTRQENPTVSVVLDFSVWYCLSGTELAVC